MIPNSPITLYPNPPYTQDELLSDVSSDFPLIRVRESSPPGCVLLLVLLPLIDSPVSAETGFFQQFGTVLAPFSTAK
jgi:hypothetical protein